MDTKRNINTIKGFTLVELVIVMTLSGIIMMVVGNFISIPILAYRDVVSRANLVDAADVALNRLKRDFQNAIPNSIRIKQDLSNNLYAIEFANTVEAFRYRANAPGTEKTWLDFTKTNDAFDVMNLFDDVSVFSSNHRLVVNNTGESGSSTDDPLLGRNLWYVPPNSTTPHVITPVGTSLGFANNHPDANANEGHITLSPAFRFASESPKKRQRIYVMDTPVTYVCVPSVDGGTLTRYWGYPIDATQPINPTASPLVSANSALLVDKVRDCSFEYVESDPSSRHAIVNLRLSLTENGETITLMQQVSVSNVP